MPPAAVPNNNPILFRIQVGVMIGLGHFHCADNLRHRRFDIVPDRVVGIEHARDVAGSEIIECTIAQADGNVAQVLPAFASCPGVAALPAGRYVSPASMSSVVPSGRMQKMDSPLPVLM